LATDNDLPAIPTRTSYLEAAQAMVAQTRAMRQQVPKFVIPPSSREGSRLSNAASVSPEFVELSAVSVTHSAPLVREGAMTPEQTRDLIRYANAFDPVADELEALARFIRYSTLAARNQAGREALTTYAVAKVLAKRQETADLVPFVEAMRRALGRTRKSKPKPAPSPATQDPTEPTTPSQ
jgi:hypothetical protein